MDNKGQNKQKNFWTVFAIVVAIFAILLATGVIERGPQPQAAEQFCFDNGGCQPDRINYDFEKVAISECNMGSELQADLCPKTGDRCTKDVRRLCFSFSKKGGGEKDECNNQCRGNTTCQEQSGSCDSVSRVLRTAFQKNASWADPCKEHEKEGTEDEKKRACRDDSDSKCQWFSKSACVCENCGNYCNEEAGTVCNKDTGQCDCTSKDDDEKGKGNACTRADGNCIALPGECGSDQTSSDLSCLRDGVSQIIQTHRCCLSKTDDDDKKNTCRGVTFTTCRKPGGKGEDICREYGEMARKDLSCGVDSKLICCRQLRL